MRTMPHLLLWNRLSLLLPVFSFPSSSRFPQPWDIPLNVSGMQNERTHYVVPGSDPQVGWPQQGCGFRLHRVFWDAARGPNSYPQCLMRDA